MTQNPYHTPENNPADGYSQQHAQSQASSAPAPIGYSAPSAPSAPASAAYPGTNAGATGGAHGPVKGPSGTAAKGFFGALFDFSFRHFMTIRFVQIFFVIGIVLSILYYIVGFIVAIIMGSAASYYGDFNAWPIILYVLFGWIAPVLSVLALRVVLEFMVATIRTAQNSTEIVDHLRARG